MDALSQVAAGAEHLVQSLKPAYIVGDSSLGLSNFVFWMFICLAITLVVVLVASRRLSLVPKGRFASMVEYGYDFVSGGIAKDVIGHGYEKHVPLLATLFFFILISNFVGLIPGCKTPTGSLSITWALAAVSFVYFIYWGIKAQGLGGYLKSFAPSGLPVPMIPIVWFLELFSTVLRVLTLAVRLYGNMFAGHMVLGIFALLTSLFIGSAIAAVGDFLSGPTACAILFVVGYNIEFSRDSLRDAVRSSGVRLVFCAAFCALCVLFLTWTVGMTDLLRWALILLFTLPGPYVLPVFARGEADARYASSCLSLYTLLSVAMFCVIAVLAA